MAKSIKPKTGTDDPRLTRFWGRTIPDLDRKAWEREIDSLKVLFRKTKNPMYVWQAIHIYTSLGQNFDLPQWCIFYLAKASNNLLRLSRNQKIDGKQLKWPSLEVDKINPQAALKEIPRALGLAGSQGKGFLRDFNNRAQKGYELSLYENLRANGLSRRDATEMVLRINGREDERNLRRAFAESDVRMGGLGQRRKGKT